MRHNLWEILSGWGRRSGLRQLNSGKIYRKVGRADCRNDFSNTLWYAEAFRPVQSYSQTSEWYIYFENDVPDTKKACRNICRVELICYIWLINGCLIFLYKKLWNGSPSQSSDTTFIQKINCTIIFFHPDCTVGPGISPDHASRLAGFTAGRESHPALKISFCLF